MKSFSTTAALLLLVAALMHLARVLIGFPVLVGDFEVPLFLSGIAAVAFGGVGVMALFENMGRK